MPNITDNISFDTIAREWRCKWSADNNKASLSALQDLLDKHTPALKAMQGVNIQRIVCGQCNDFKVILSFPADVYSKWAEDKHAPEEEFLTEMGAIPGVSNVET